MPFRVKNISKYEQPILGVSINPVRTKDLIEEGVSADTIKQSLLYGEVFDKIMGRAFALVAPLEDIEELGLTITEISYLIHTGFLQGYLGEDELKHPFRFDGYGLLTQPNLSKDDSTQAILTIDYAHHEVHEGSHFSIDTVEDGLSAAFAWHIKTVNSTKESHMVFSSQVNNGGTWEMYEDPTLSDDGTQIDGYNSNRNSTKTPLTLVYSSPTITDNGVRIGFFRFASGVGAQSKAPGSGRAENETILKTNASYLLIFTPDVPGTNVYLHIGWYEHTPIA